nr:MAG TPA: hypothetical protein [Caudoviricetes sp.]
MVRVIIRNNTRLSGIIISAYYNKYGYYTK